MNYKISAVISLLATISMAPASASIITFSDLGLVNYDEIPQTYGDNINSLNDGIGSYLEGNAFTPNISVSYRTADASRNTVENHVEFWTNNYGDLTGVAYPSQNALYAEITFTPDVGHSVTLNSFDMAGYNQSDLALGSLQVLDYNGSTLWDSGVSSIHGAGPTHDTFLPNVSSSLGITIRWGTNWNVGIDNINFDQDVAPVPVPAAAWFFGSGLLSLVGMSRFKNKKV